MMMALQASFGLVENDRKQVYSLIVIIAIGHNLLRLQATAFLQQMQQQPGFSQILLAVISQVRSFCPVAPFRLHLTPAAGRAVSSRHRQLRGYQSKKSLQEALGE